MYTIVGLGNPGVEYERTRHNAGRRLVEKIAHTYEIEMKKKKKPDHYVGSGLVFDFRTRIILPETFMNNSGKVIVPYIKSVSAAKKLVVVYDEIDLPLGVVRVSFGNSSAGHNGVRSVERAIKTRQFIKIRVGVAKKVRGKAKKPTGEKAVVDYLLAKFTRSELEKIDVHIYERVTLALEKILETNDPVMGMNAVNGLPPQ